MRRTRAESNLLVGSENGGFARVLPDVETDAGKLA